MEDASERAAKSRRRRTLLLAQELMKEEGLSLDELGQAVVRETKLPGDSGFDLDDDFAEQAAPAAPAARAPAAAAAAAGGAAPDAPNPELAELDKRVKDGQKVLMAVEARTRQAEGSIIEMARQMGGQHRAGPCGESTELYAGLPEFTKDVESSQAPHLCRLFSDRLTVRIVLNDNLASTLEAASTALEAVLRKHNKYRKLAMAHEHEKNLRLPTNAIYNAICDAVKGRPQLMTNAPIAGVPNRFSISNGDFVVANGGIINGKANIYINILKSFKAGDRTVSGHEVRQHVRERWASPFWVSFSVVDPSLPLAAAPSFAEARSAKGRGKVRGRPIGARA